MKALKILTQKTKKHYLQIITNLQITTFHTEMIFSFRKREGKGVKPMALSLWT